MGATAENSTIIPYLELSIGSVAPPVWILEDTESNIGIDSARQLFANNQFEKTAADFNLGYSRSSYWVRFSFTLESSNEDITTHDTILEFHYPHLDSIEITRIDPDGTLHSKGYLGDTQPFNTRPIDSNVFVLSEKLNMNQRYEYWVKMTTSSSNQLHLSIWNKDRYLERRSHTQMAYGVYFGIQIIMAIYNLFIGFSTKDRSYFLYFGCISSMIVLQGSLLGYSYQYIWPSYPGINDYALPIIVICSSIFSCLFGQSFLKTRYNAPRHHKVINFAILISFALALAGLTVDYRLRILLSILSVFLCAPLLIFTAATVFFKGHKYAKYYVLAWTCLLGGAVTYAFTALGILPSNLFTTHAGQVGMTLEVVLLSFALADRINRIKAEKRSVEINAKKMLESKNQQLEDALDLLRVSNSLKDEFLATISHELRTPMNGIEGSLELVKESLSDQTLLKHMNAASHSAHHMSQLVESLLEYSELQSGNWKLNEQPFCLKSIAEKCANIIHSEYAKANIKFTINVNKALNHLLIGDKDRINHLLFQLLDNAFKFTHQGTIELNIDAAEQDDSYDITFKIIDSGIGINPAEYKVIFDGFRQADGSFSRQYGGLGIGLSLCKAIVDKMKGKITVDSLPNKGTTFTIYISFQKDSLIKAKEITNTNQPFNKKILVVEDNAVNQMTLVAMLKKLGCQVDKANNGEEAVRKASESTYDCIMMDCQMPIMDGFDATKFIRNLDNDNANTPIIAVTANAMSDDRDRCISSGMNDYIRKPIKKDIIIERLSHWLLNDAA